MRLIIRGTSDDVEVIAEPFAITGTDDAFAVHVSLELLSGIGFYDWSATHIPTGLTVARGNEIDEVIAMARATWISKTPEQLATAIAEGHKRQAEMIAARGAA